MIDQMVEEGIPILNEKGYEIELIVIGDPVQLNEALNDGGVDLNFQQHEIYMEQFNENRSATLSKVGDKLYSQVIGLYSTKYNSLDEIKPGDMVTIQNDPTNRDRALKLLSDSGLIELDENAGQDEPYSLLDITDNPLDLEFVEVSGEALIKSLQDTAVGIVTGLNAAKGGFFVEDALAIYDIEDKDKYALILVAANEEDANSKWALDAYEALKSEEVQEKVEEVSHGAWKPIFK